MDIFDYKSNSWFAFLRVIRIRNKQIIVITGYVLATGWFLASTAWAVYSFNLTAPLPEAAVPVASASPLPPNDPVEFPSLPESVASLRDPFSASVVPEAAQSVDNAAVSHSGLHLVGVILSRKNGIVLKDAQSGAVYFLSEGEEADGIRVNRITNSRVSVEANGKTQDFPVSGVKK
jgi:type II secretory pathway component PulC